MDPHLIGQQNGVAQPGLPQPEKFQIVNGYLQVGKKRYQIHYYPQGKQADIKPLLNLNQKQEELFLKLLEAANVNRDKLAELAISAKGTTYKSNPTTYTPLPDTAKNLFNKLTEKASQAMRQSGREVAAAQGISPIERKSNIPPSDGEFFFEEVTVSPPVNKPTFREELFKFPFILNFAAGMQIHEINNELKSKISDLTLKMLRTELEKSPQALIDFEKAYQDSAIKPLIIDFLKAHSAFVDKKDSGQSSEEFKNFLESQVALLNDSYSYTYTFEIFVNIYKSATGLAVAREYSSNITSLSGKSIDSAILERAVMDHPKFISMLTQFFRLTDKIEKNQRDKQIWLEPENANEDIHEDVDNLSKAILGLEEVLKSVKGGDTISEALREIEHRVLNPLKKDLIQLLGKKEIHNINIALSKPSESIVSPLAAFVQAAIAAQKINALALKDGKIPDRESIKKLLNARLELEDQLLRIDINSQMRFENIWSPLQAKIMAKCTHDFEVNDLLIKMQNINGKPLTSHARTQLARACEHKNFLEQLQSLVNKSNQVIRNEKKAYPQWVEGTKDFSTTAIKEDLDSIREMIKNLTGQLPNKQRENRDALLFLNQLEQAVISPIALHIKVIDLVNESCLINNISEETRKTLIAYLTTQQICNAYEGFITSIAKDVNYENNIKLFISLEKSGAELEVLATNAWKIPDIQLNDLAEKIKTKNSILDLTDNDRKILNIIGNNNAQINSLEIKEKFPEWFKNKLINLKILNEYNKFYNNAEKFRKNEIIISITSAQITTPQNPGKIEGEIPSEYQELLRNLKAFQQNSPLRNDFDKLRTFPLTKEQKEIFDALDNNKDKIDKIIRSYTLDGSNAFSDSYRNLAIELHKQFTNQNGHVDIEKGKPLPTLEQLKVAINLLQSKMTFLLSTPLNEQERIAVAELLCFIMVGEEEASKLPRLESEFAFTWKEAKDYAIPNKIQPLEGKDLLYSFLEKGKNDEIGIEAKRNAHINAFFLDYHRFAHHPDAMGNIGETIHIKIDDNMAELKPNREHKAFFESLRDNYYQFLINHPEEINNEIAYNKAHTDLISPTITSQSFSQLLSEVNSSKKAMILPEKKISEIVQATTFTPEQLQTLSPFSTNQEELASLLRIKVLKFMIAFNQIPYAYIQSQALEGTSSNCIFNAIVVKSDGEITALETHKHRKWVIDQNLNNIDIGISMFITNANTKENIGIYRQEMQIYNFSSSTNNSNATINSISTLEIGPFSKLEDLDKIIPILKK